MNAVGEAAMLAAQAEHQLYFAPLHYPLVDIRLAGIRQRARVDNLGRALLRRFHQVPVGSAKRILM